ncbi:MAG: T9SS type A sorting domain-containing protein [Bacteroidia bacterium]|nr:T9SS type A sorting domain-containing protein [Bacteroidia bacterium]
MKKILIIAASIFLHLTLVFSLQAQTIGGRLANYQKENDKSVQVLCDTLFSFPTTETWPAGLAWDGQNLWLTSHDIPLIKKLSPSGIELGSIPSPTISGSSGGGLDFDGVDLWAVIEQDNMLYRINPNTGTVKRQFTLPSQGTGDPNGWGIAYDGKNMWYSQYLPPILFKMDTATGLPIETFNLPATIISIHAINGKLYGINTIMPGAQKLYRFNMTNGTLIDSAEWCIPYPLGLTWDGANLWNVSSMISVGGNQRVYKIGSAILNDVEDYQNFFHDGASLVVSPNPVKDILIIEISNPHPSTLRPFRQAQWPQGSGFCVLNSKFEILNITGQVIYSSVIHHPSSVIDLSELPSGVYLIKLNTEKSAIIKRFVKQ